MYLNAKRIKEDNPEGSLASLVVCHAMKGKEALKQHRIPEKSRQSVNWDTKNTPCSAQFQRPKTFPYQEQIPITFDLLIIMSSIFGRISKVIHPPRALTIKQASQ